MRREADIAPVLASLSSEAVQIDLRRFLRAKNGDPEAAFVKACNFYRWSISERPDLIGDDDIGAELDSGKLVYMCKDKEGRPVFLVRARLHFSPSHPNGFERSSTEKLLIAAVRFAVANMKAACHNFSIVADMEGFGISNMDSGVLRALGALLSKYFPGRLHRLYVINPPFVMWGFWKLIRPLVNKKWMETLHFMSHPNELHEFIDTRNLPVSYGGDIFVNDRDLVIRSKQMILQNQQDLMRTQNKSAGLVQLPLLRDIPRRKSSYCI